MKIAICCPGPGLNRLAPIHESQKIPPLDGYETIIGVNRAPFIMLAWCIPVWVKAWCFDGRAFLSGEVPYKPLLCCSEKDINFVGETRGPQYPVVTHENLLKGTPGDTDWCDFSVTSAIVLAARLGGRQIDCYGSDWTDEPDADGVMLPDCLRTAKRWKEEKRVWDNVIKYLKPRGIMVERK